MTRFKDQVKTMPKKEGFGIRCVDQANNIAAENFLINRMFNQVNMQEKSVEVLYYQLEKLNGGGSS